MTVKKALELLNYYSEKKSIMKKDFLNRNMPWNHGDVSLYPVSEGMAQVMETDLEFIKAIKSQIEPNCKHPKKFQDIDPDGNSYCMDCNMDL
ncbi:MAG: hypothetical protein OEL81_00870 [Nitrosopumilus sp.]|nr:hypothetical protein [Nitrosopumilus sp.]